MIESTLNLPEIAHTILELRASALALANGPLQEALGEAGYTEAVRRRWVLPDMDTGFLSITHHVQTVQEMMGYQQQRQQAGGIGDTVMVADDGQPYQGVVSKVNPDGSYTLSFPNNKKPRTVRNYKAPEVRVTQRVQTARPGQAGATTGQPGTARPVSAMPVVP